MGSVAAIDCATTGFVAKVQNDGTGECGRGWHLGGNAGVASNEYLGTSDARALTLAVNGTPALTIQPQNPKVSPTITAGWIKNRAIGVGVTINGGGGWNACTTSCDGYANVAYGDFGTVGGGTANSVGYAGTVAGGISNNNNGDNSTISGGVNGVIMGDSSVIGGGQNNYMVARLGTISGGGENQLWGPGATIGGGQRNTAIGANSTIGGGQLNAAEGEWSTVPGGFANEASGAGSFAAGARAIALHNNSFVWSDGLRFASTQPGQFLVRAPGGVGINTNAPTSDLSFGASSKPRSIGVENGFSGTGLNITAGSAATGQDMDGGTLVLRAGGSTGSAGSRIDFVTATPGATGNVARVPTTKMTLAGNGNLGLGTSTPNGKLSIQNVGGQDGVNLLTFSEDETSEFVIESGFAGFGATGNYLKLATVWGNTAMSWRGDGRVGIGTVAPEDALAVRGDIRVGTAGANGCIRSFGGNVVAGACSSDARFKNNVTAIGRALDGLVKLVPVEWNWRSAEFPDRHFGDTRAYGLIAQDVEKQFPEMVGEDDEGYKTVDYTRLPLLLLQGLKDLSESHDKLAQENAALKAQLAAQDARLDRIEALLAVRLPAP